MSHVADLLIVTLDFTEINLVYVFLQDSQIKLVQQMKHAHLGIYVIFSETASMYGKWTKMLQYSNFNNIIITIRIS